MEDKKSPGWKALERAKMKTEERKCGKHSLPLPDKDFKRASHAILNSSVFWREELKGKVSKNKNKQYVTYPIKDPRGLIAKLVNAHLARLNFNINEIIDRQLRSALGNSLPRDLLFQDAKTLDVANQAEIDRITQNGHLQDLKDLEDRVQDALNEILQKPLHLSLAKIFHTYAPSAPISRLAEWVNVVLKALGQNQIKHGTLRGNITDEIIPK